MKRRLNDEEIIFKLNQIAFSSYEYSEVAREAISLIFDLQDEIKRIKENIPMNEILIRYHNDNIDKIEEITNGDWIDLRAAETVELKAGDFKIISLGVSMKLPEGYEAHIVPRSSTFKKWGILQTNHMGVIDNSYSGDNDIWGMPVLAMRDTVIKENDRICQFRIVERMGDVSLKQVDHLEGEDRGGFGSTGHN